jgi:aminomethyltransferase
MSDALLRTSLHGRHLEAGARLAPFAGFEMPVVYGSIVAEHRAVRESAGLFDVSHMGEVRIRGRQALELAQRVFSNDVAGTRLGRVRYGLLCLEDGGVVDDVTLYRTGEQEVLLCVNASNIAADLAWIREVHQTSGLDCDVIDESEQTALMALQGPRALELAGALLPDDFTPPRRWRFESARMAGLDVCLSRTGYTGEDGYEIYVAAEHAGSLWDALVDESGSALTLAGLGARDTLRTEMGYSLYGHELDREHDPVEAGLERFLAFDQDFIGRDAVQRTARDGPERRLVGLLLEGRQVARTGYPILADQPIGVVTSGTFGPSVERSIAMGYVGARYATAGTPLAVEVRKRRVACRVTPTPFFSRKS